jgi:uncharacterized protein (TIGR03437 family)
VQPAFYPWPGNQIVATHNDLSILPSGTAPYAAKPGTFAGVTTVPAKPGEIILLWGTGFGPVNPPFPAGQVPGPQVAGSPTQMTPTVTLGGTTISVISSVLSAYAADYQIAIQIPSSQPNGDYPVAVSMGAVASLGNLVLTVQQ